MVAPRPCSAQKFSISWVAGITPMSEVGRPTLTIAPSGLSSRR